MADKLSIEVVEGSHHVVLRLNGYVNRSGGEEIKNTVGGLVSSDHTHYVFNAEFCDMINSVGVALLLDAIDAIRESGARITFCHATSTVARTLKIMGILKVAGLADTESDALSI